MINEKKTDQYGIIILAAGSSSRLGSPKQLLPFNNITLLQNAIEVAQATGADGIVVVITEDLKETVGENPGVIVVVNDRAQEGLSSSIKKGMETLERNFPLFIAAFIMLCDQPFVTTAALINLVKKFEETKKPIIASAYGGSYGTPALFQRTYFPRLMTLSGDSGAKKIISQNPGDMSSLELPNGEIDIDTTEDIEKWQNILDSGNTEKGF